MDEHEDEPERGAEDGPEVRFLDRPLHVVDPDIAVADGDRVFAKTLLEVLYSVEGEVDEAGWGQPHRLLLLHDSTADAARADGYRTMVVGELGPFTAAAEGVGAARPHQVIHALAGALRSNPGATAVDLLPPGLHARDVLAVAAVTEAWLVNGPGAPATPPGDAASTQDRVEVRLVRAVDRHGNRYTITHERDSVARHEVSADGAGAAGAVSDALAELVAAVEAALPGTAGGPSAGA